MVLHFSRLPFPDPAPLTIPNRSQPACPVHPVEKLDGPGLVATQFCREIWMSGTRRIWQWWYAISAKCIDCFQFSSATSVDTSMLWPPSPSWSRMHPDLALEPHSVAVQQ